VTLNGAAVSAGFQALGHHDGTGYQYAHVEIDTGHYVIESGEPLAITVVGYSKDVSFGYPGGSGVAAISEAPPIL